MKRITATRRTLLGGAALSALLLTAACGGNDMGGMDHGSTPAPTTASASVGAAFNDADVQFAQMMIPHHQQAVQMAELARARAADPEVKTMAAKIKGAQDPEITKMTGWLTTWGRPTAAAQGHNMPGMSGMHGGMPGMMSEQDMTALKAASGLEFDRMFARMMIAHHNGAIEMAKVEQSSGSNSEAKALAAEIEKTQAAEVQQLQKILDRL